MPFGARAWKLLGYFEKVVSTFDAMHAVESDTISVHGLLG